jgi:Delta7-sterol 5-desaturase
MQILNILFESIIYFFVWTFFLYWIHRASHRIAFLKTFHFDHHNFILTKLRKKEQPTRWHWSNLFLFNDTWKSTLDLWMSEVIPTFLFSWLTGQWWILIFYYLWAALIQEIVEHDPSFDVPILTSGRWHLLHHTTSTKNYGLFTSLWDRVFGSNQGFR